MENDDELFPHREPNVFYDFGGADDTEWLVEEITGHKWEKKGIKFEVRWNLGDTTWEPLESCEELEALDRYLELMGVEKVEELPRKPVLRGGGNRGR